MTSATHSDLAPILDKIARLKGLAERPGTPEEAAAATAAISRLMLRYNLSEMQVDAAGRNDRQGFDNTDYDLGASMMWRKNLMSRIARYSFCEAIFDHKGRGVHIVGERHNVQIVTGLFEYLTEAIMRLADEGWDALDSFEKSYNNARGWKHAFRTGAGQTVGERLEEQYRQHKAEAQAEDSQTGALVIVKDKELAEAVRKFYPRLRNSSSRASFSNGSGLAAGQAAGRQINLASQIGG